MLLRTPGLEPADRYVLPQTGRPLAVLGLGAWPTRFYTAGAEGVSPASTTEPRDLSAVMCSDGMCVVPVGEARHFAPGLIPNGTGMIATPGGAARGAVGTAYEVTVHVAGREFVERFAPKVWLHVLFAWDGIDDTGAVVSGTTLGNTTDTYARNPFGEPGRDVAVLQSGVGCWATGEGACAPTGGGSAPFSEPAPFAVNLADPIPSPRATTGGCPYECGVVLSPPPAGALARAGSGHVPDLTLNPEPPNPSTACSSSESVESVQSVVNLPATLTHHYTYTHDATGALSAKFDLTANPEPPNPLSSSFSYDGFGNLRSATLPDGGTIAYLIDPAQRRVGKVKNGHMESKLLYQSSLRPVARLDANNAVVDFYVYADKANVPEYMERAGTSYRLITDRVLVRSDVKRALSRHDITSSA